MEEDGFPGSNSWAVAGSLTAEGNPLSDLSRDQLVDELQGVVDALEGAISVLGGGGRLVVMAYHSLEDRRVKQSFRSWASTGEYEILTRRVVRASDEELENNPASRSAKLRALERKQQWARRN